MRKLFPVVAFLVITFFSCSKQCQCTKWLNSVAIESFEVALESDGSECSEYSFNNDSIVIDTAVMDSLTIDSISNLINGVICIDYE